MRMHTSSVGNYAGRVHSPKCNPCPALKLFVFLLASWVRSTIDNMSIVLSVANIIGAII